MPLVTRLIYNEESPPVDLNIDQLLHPESFAGNASNILSSTGASIALSKIDQYNLLTEKFKHSIKGTHYLTYFKSSSELVFPFFKPRMLRGYFEHSSPIKWENLSPGMPLQDRPYTEIYTKLRTCIQGETIDGGVFPNPRLDLKYTPLFSDISEVVSFLIELLQLALIFAAIQLLFMEIYWGFAAVLACKLIIYKCNNAISNFGPNESCHFARASEKFNANRISEANECLSKVNASYLHLGKNSKTYLSYYYNLKGLIHLARIQSADTNDACELLSAKDNFKKASQLKVDPTYSLNYYQSLIFSNEAETEDAIKLRDDLGNYDEISWYMAGLSAKHEQ
jgi:hypothetical protein